MKTNPVLVIVTGTTFYRGSHFYPFHAFYPYELMHLKESLCLLHLGLGITRTEFIYLICHFKVKVLLIFLNLICIKVVTKPLIENVFIMQKITTLWLKLFFLKSHSPTKMKQIIIYCSLTWLYSTILPNLPNKVKSCYSGDFMADISLWWWDSRIYNLFCIDQNLL